LPPERSVTLRVYVAAAALPLARPPRLPIPVVAAGYGGRLHRRRPYRKSGRGHHPDADPHDFAPPPSVARAVSDAGLVIEQYRLRPLDGASPQLPPDVIASSSMLARSSAQKRRQPHLWYDRAPSALCAITAISAGRGAAQHQIDSTATPPLLMN
jgi:hypothetical protein